MNKYEKVEKLRASGMTGVDAAKKTGVRLGAYYSWRHGQKKKTKKAARKAEAPEMITINMGDHQCSRCEELKEVIRILSK